MITETTFNRVERQRKQFEWCATPDGILLNHLDTDNPAYLIPWKIFHKILCRAMEMASKNNNFLIAGTDQADPTPGSLGEWILSQGFHLKTGNLTPRHLSFIGPILKRMGFISNEWNGNSIKWIFDYSGMRKNWPQTLPHEKLSLT